MEGDSQRLTSLGAAAFLHPIYLSIPQTTSPTDSLSCSTMATQSLRATRSGAPFSPWAMPITPPADFNFERLLEEGLSRQCLGDIEDSESAFSLSPLTSPEPSPEPSPAASPAFTRAELPAYSTPSSPAAVSPAFTCAELPGCSTPSSPAASPTFTRAELPGCSAPSSPESLCANPAPAAVKHKRNKKQGHANRRLKRAKLNETVRLDKLKARPRASAKYVMKSEAARSTFDSKGIRMATTGYVGVREGKTAVIYRLDQLVGDGSAFGFRVHAWNGRYATSSSLHTSLTHHACRVPTPILDKAGRIIAVLVGRPDDASWDAAQAEAADALEHTRGACVFQAKHTCHGRGRFPALQVGISFGGGQPKPKNCANDAPNERVLKALISHPAFCRIAAFGASKPPKIFMTYTAP